MRGVDKDSNTPLLLCCECVTSGGGDAVEYPISYIYVTSIPFLQHHIRSFICMY